MGRATRYKGDRLDRAVDYVDHPLSGEAIECFKRLVVVHDSKLVGENYKLFCLFWEKIAAGVKYDEWTVLFVKDIDAGLGLVGGRIFRAFARGILDSNDVGIVEFTP